MAENKRIPELFPSTTGAKDGEYAIYNPSSDTTERTRVQESLGAVQASFNWDVNTGYSIDQLVFSNNKVWRSLVNGNIGNVPNENSFWTNEPISTADGITDTQYSPGVFTYNSSKVVYNNIGYYLQIPAPYLSSDIDAEILAGDWATGIEVSTPITVTGGTVENLFKSDQHIIVLKDATTYQLQLLSTVTDKTKIQNLKNDSGGQVTITTQTPDLIEGEVLQTLNDSENITLYLTTTEYRVL